MRIAFHILRMNWYRAFAPLIDEALRRDCVVECWHNVGNRRMGANNVDAERIPIFKYGRPIVKDYSGLYEFIRLVKANNVDAIVDVFPPLAKDPDGNDDTLVPGRMKEWPPYSDRPYWILLDDIPSDCVVTIKNEEQLFSCDMFVLRTSYWADYHVQAMSADLTEILRSIKSKKSYVADYMIKWMEERQVFRWKEQHVRYFLEHVKCAGYPMIDPLASMDSEEVRSFFHIPSNVPVVTYLPNPYIGTTTTWERMYATTSMPARLIQAILEWDREAMRNAIAPSHDDAVVNAIDIFRRNNGAFLVSKSRHSQQVMPYVKKSSSLILGDESYYPFTMISLLAISDLCIGSYSSTVYEACAANTFFVNVDIPFFPHSFYETYIPIEQIYNYPGVTVSMDAATFSRKFGVMKIDEFRTEAHSRKAFIDKYVGPIDGNSSGRFMDSVEALIAKGRA